MVQHNQIPIHEVEAVQLVTRLFGVHDIFIDHIRCAFSLVVCARADLSNGPKLAEEIEECGCVDVVGEVLDEEDAVCFWREFVGARHGWWLGRVVSAASEKCASLGSMVWLEDFPTSGWGEFEVSAASAAECSAGLQMAL